MIKTRGGASDMNTKRTMQKGAVSLFVVIFTSLLFVAVTVGFTVLMLSDQNQSTDNDLAQSALDSANAGTEDAKRVLAQYSSCVEAGKIGTDYETASEGDQCSRIAQAIKSSSCNVINAAVGEGSTEQERVIRQSETDEALDQAYTCVKISPDTDSFIGKIRDEGDVRVIPLKTDGNAFDTVKISWLSPTKDFEGEGEARNLNLSPVEFDLHGSTGLPEVAEGREYAPDYLGLPSKEQWISDRRGAILRAGIIGYEPNGAVTVGDLDKQARTVMLNAASMGGSSNPGDFDRPVFMNQHDRHVTVDDANHDRGYLEPFAVNTPTTVNCDKESTSGYLCTTYIKLSDVAADNFKANQLYYLTVASLYRNASFQIQLLNGRDTVNFRNVQPEIDATGRANDVFRRVVSRVESSDASESPYPRAAVGSKSSVCKSFVITDDPDDFRTDHPGMPECANLKEG